jgi:hypothetical protein
LPGTITPPGNLFPSPSKTHPFLGQILEGRHIKHGEKIITGASMAVYGIERMNVRGIKDAEKAIRETDACEESVPIMAPKLLFYVLKLKKVRNAVANILKQESISVGAEASVSQYCVNCSRPNSTVVLSGTLSQLRKLVVKLKQQGYLLPETVAPEYKALAEEIEEEIRQVK